MADISMSDSEKDRDAVNRLAAMLRLAGPLGGTAAFQPG